MKNDTAFALAVADVAKMLNVKRLGVGTHTIEETVTLTITGTVTVGKDYDQRMVAEADPWKLLLVALSKLNGVTMESIVKEAEAGELDTAAVKLEAEKQIGVVWTAKEKAEYAQKKEQAELAGLAIDTIKEGTWKECKGKVTKKLNIQVEALESV